MSDEVKTDGFELKDSGDRRSFSTGSVRDVRDGKGRYDLLSPAAIRRLAKLYEAGAKKYGDRNWEKGQPLGSYVDSMLRHAFCYLDGQRDEDHIAAVIWNACSIIHTEQLIAEGKLPPEFNDIPTKSAWKCGVHEPSNPSRYCPMCGPSVPDLDGRFCIRAGCDVMIIAPADYCKAHEPKVPF